MRINVAEWRKLDWGQKYIMILIAYGYWQDRHQKRRKPTTGKVVSFGIGKRQIEKHSASV